MREPDAYVGHDGKLVARCECGWWAAGTEKGSALAALLAHKKECGGAGEQ